MVNNHWAQLSLEEATEVCGIGSPAWGHLWSLFCFLVSWDPGRDAHSARLAKALSWSLREAGEKWRLGKGSGMEGWIPVPWKSIVLEPFPPYSFRKVSMAGNLVFVFALLWFLFFPSVQCGEEMAWGGDCPRHPGENSLIAHFSELQGQCAWDPWRGDPSSLSLAQCLVCGFTVGLRNLVLI